MTSIKFIVNLIFLIWWTLTCGFKHFSRLRDAVLICRKKNNCIARYYYNICLNKTSTTMSEVSRFGISVKTQSLVEYNTEKLLILLFSSLKYVVIFTWTLSSSENEMQFLQFSVENAAKMNFCCCCCCYYYPQPKCKRNSQSTTTCWETTPSQWVFAMSIRRHLAMQLRR